MKNSLIGKKMRVLSLGLVLMLVFSFSLINVSFADGHGGMKDIVDTAIEADGFNTLVTAVQEAGLVEALKAEGPYTVFAPTDEAFANLPEGTLDNLLANPDQLKNVLLFHVIEGKVMAEDVLGMDGAMVETLLGETVKISIKDGMVYINDAQVITTDIETSNGVIHVINKVLVP
ncbi:MAG: fasciclin domain-containing protein [Halanaerobiales bacterium]|nr:fasciclin domain-containing protein [Halanaerobiales bacterium]